MRCLAVASVAAVLLVPGCHVHDDRDEFISAAWPADFNRDGLAEVVIGAPLDDFAAVDAGRVTIHLGSAAWDSAGDIFLTGTQAGGQFGFAAAPIGDFNGDGYADLAVGAPLEDGTGGVDSGRVHVFYGGPGFPATGPVLNGTEAAGQFGFAVARAGDVNRDGYDDLLVGAPLENAGGVDRGRAHLFLGGASPGTTPVLDFDGGEDLSCFGRTVSTAGDVNADGYFDWIIGAPCDDAGVAASDRGRAFLYLGAASPDNSVDQTFSGAEDDATFGWCVAGVLDLNRDGYADLAIGAPEDDGDGISTDSGADLGRAYVYYGSPAIDTIPEHIFTGSETGSRFGELVARVGDVNAGGAPDLLVGAPGDDVDGNVTENGLNRGRAFVYFGGPTMDTVADVVWSGTEAGGEFGTSADSPGDHDGDGIRDVVVGAPLDDADGNPDENLLDRGRAFWFRGATVPSTTPALTYSSVENGAHLGRAVACNPARGRVVS